MSKERWKLRPIGGSVKHKESSIETLIREFEEEIENEEAKRILIKSLRENGKYYVTLRDVVGGKLYETDLYLVNVSSKREWEIVKSSRLTDDAGFVRILPFKDVLDKPDEDFAFGSKTIKDVVRQIYNNPVHYNLMNYRNSNHSLLNENSMHGNLKPIDFISQPLFSMN